MCTVELEELGEELLEEEDFCSVAVSNANTPLVVEESAYW
jgi:hypothetical protein